MAFAPSKVRIKSGVWNVPDPGIEPITKTCPCNLQQFLKAV